MNWIAYHRSEEKYLKKIEENHQKWDIDFDLFFSLKKFWYNYSWLANNEQKKSTNFTLVLIGIRYWYRILVSDIGIGYRYWISVSDIGIGRWVKNGISILSVSADKKIEFIGAYRYRPIWKKAYRSYTIFVPLPPPCG